MDTLKNPTVFQLIIGIKQLCRITFIWPAEVAPNVSQNTTSEKTNNLIDTFYKPGCFVLISSATCFDLTEELLSRLWSLPMLHAGQGAEIADCSQLFSHLWLVFL